ncbi:MAG: RNA polymerase sigma factor [Muribaculaceae bacterium]|nr:RNA polymerase sigma factor [Muribaculaceae bacterium]
MNSKKSSDLEMFKSIVSRYQDRLFRFAFVRIGIREVAEDIVQDVFIRFFQSFSGGSKIANHESYLFHSISNACVDYHRRSKFTILSLEEIEETPDDEDKEIKEEYLRIKLLLEDLAFEQAETVRLKCYDGLTFLQIAEIHDVPEATVKSRYRYAIRRIREKLNRQNMV